MYRSLVILILIILPAEKLFAQAGNGPVHSKSRKNKTEKKYLEVIRQFHNGSTPVKKLRESGLLAENVEWWVPGPKDILPFAGMWKGPEGIAEFHNMLGKTMHYDKAEVKEYFVDGNTVAAIFWGEGTAISSGKPFRSEILRLYTFEDGKIIRVRNYYDTASYVAAVTGN